MGMVTSAQLIAMILQLFKDQYGGSLLNKILWIFRRVIFLMRSWFFDIQYYTIDVDDLLDALSKWKEEILNNISYLPEIFDCDDFAMYFKTWLQGYIQQEKDTPFNGVGVAIGQVFRDGELLGGHAWNFVVVQNGDNIYILFIEPQLGEIIPSNNISSDGYEYVLQAVII